MIRAVGFRVNRNKAKEINITMDKTTTIQILVTVVFMNGAVSQVYAGTISHGLQPLINVLKDLAEPVAYGFMIKGFLEIISGKEHEGKKTLKYAAAGYVGIQWIPAIFSIIRGISFGG